MSSTFQQRMVIDSRKGGNGDIWMRLVSFYAVSVLQPVQFIIYIPPFIRSLANYAFGDRLVFPEDDHYTIDLTYTNLGIKDLIKPLLKGEKFISPYQRAVIFDKKHKSVKDQINSLVFNLADVLGFVQVPDKKWITYYQGYLDIIGIKKLRMISYEAYCDQLQQDHFVLSQRLSSEALPISAELTMPSDINQRIIVFPSGTSRQFVPVWWAKQYLPDAYYAFFFKDKESELFEQNGLQVIPFYKEAGDIIKLSLAAQWTITTDSFPSHLLQSANDRCTVTITEVLASRIVSPVFKGKVVNAVAPCHPCLHLDRKNHPLCAAGYTECINWKSELYSNHVLNH